MKKLLSIFLAVAMLICMVACGTDTPAGTGNESDENAANIKIGVILIGDENEGYTYSHIKGIEEAAAKLGIADEQIIWKYTIPEDATCTETALDLVDQGCNLVISNSYGHQSYMEQAAKEAPEVQFISMTGDTAAKSGLENFSNAFTHVYQSRYVSGVVAGMKVAELVEAGKLTDANYKDGKVKIGYVGAYPYAEVVSGYTAFFLGIQSVYPEVTMDVKYTNSWFSLIDEAATAESLMADGCVIIGQHADSTGAPSAVEEAQKKGTVAYSVGYNIDMLAVAPNAALTSPTNNWSVYYEYAFNAVMNGEKVATDKAYGYADNGVYITPLGTACAAGTAEKVEEVVAAIKDGTLKVFDTSKFTVGGETLTSYTTSYGFEGNELISDGYFHESELRSAPAFDIRIDGITELS